MAHARQIVEGCRWLMTRTDAMIRSSVIRPKVVNTDRGPPLRQQAFHERRFQSVKGMLENRREFVGSHIEGQIQQFARRHPPAADYVIDNLKDVVDGATLATWRAAAERAAR